MFVAQEKCLQNFNEYFDLLLDSLLASKVANKMNGMLFLTKKNLLSSSKEISESPFKRELSPAFIPSNRTRSSFVSSTKIKFQSSSESGYLNAFRRNFSTCLALFH